MLIKVLLILIPLVGAEGEPSLTLPALLKAVESHPEVRSDRLALRESEIGKQAAYTAFAPTLNLNESWQSTTLPSNLRSNAQKLSVNLNLFNGFQDVANVKGSRIAFEISKENRKKKMLEAALAAAELYFTCLQLEKKEDEARTALDFSRQITAIEKARFEKGVRSRDDFAKLELDANNAELQVRRIQADRKSCLASLTYWAGPLSDLTELSFEKQVAHFLKSADEPAVEAHPSYVSAFKARNLTWWNTQAARGSLLPTLSFEFSKLPATNTQLESHAWMLTANWLIFDSGKNFHKVQLAHVAEQKAAENEAAIKRRLDADIRMNREKLNHAYREYTTQRSNLEVAQSLLVSSLKRFRAGTLSANDVALDQGRVVASQFGFHDSWLQMNLAWVRYQVATGKQLTDLLD